MATTEQIGVVGMTAEQKTFYSKALLARLVPALEHANHGLAEDIPPHAGKAIEKRRFESYTAATTALANEGTPPTATNGTWTAITFTISQYGAFSFISDVLEQQGFDGIDDMVNAFGEQAGNSLDQVIRDAIVGGSNVIYASTAASRGGLQSGQRLSSTEIKKAVRKLRVNNAKTFDDGYYHAIMHPDCEYDLFADTTGVVNIYQYAADRGEDNPLIQGAVPAIYGAKFFRSTNAKVFPTAGQSGTTATDVYATLFLGRDAYLVSRFSTQNVRTIIRGVGSAGALDPLDQFGSIGWKASLVAGILQNGAIVRVETTASQSANGNG